MSQSQLIGASSATRSPECLGLVSKQYSDLWFHDPPQNLGGLKEAEAVGPLCSPGYAATHAGYPERPRRWLDGTFISRSDGAATGPRDVGRLVRGRWPARGLTTLGVYSYSYVLEAAISRWGVALGWRGFIERCLDNGSLVALADRFVETGNTYYCVLAEKRRGEQIPSRTSAWSSSNTRRDNVVGRCRSGAHFALQYAFSKSEISPSLASLCALFFASLGVFPYRPVQPLNLGS